MNTQECTTRVKAPYIYRNSEILSNPCNGKDEGISLKPKEGDKPDTKKNKDIRLLEYKKYIQITKLNVRTIRTPDKLYEMEKKFNGCNLHIIGITDHKIVHKEKIRIQQCDKYTLITTTVWRNSNGAASEGVGLMVSWKSEKALTKIKSINDRIIMTNFNSNPNSCRMYFLHPTNIDSPLKK